MGRVRTARAFQRLGSPPFGNYRYSSIAAKLLGFDNFCRCRFKDLPICYPCSPGTVSLWRNDALAVSVL